MSGCSNVGERTGEGAAVSATAAFLAVALGLALLLNRRPAGYQVYRTLIFLPAILSLVATGFIWTVLLDPQIGVINPLLQSMGLGFIHPEWLASPHLALAVVIVVSWWQWGGVRLWRGDGWAFSAAACISRIVACAGAARTAAAQVTVRNAG